MKKRFWILYTISCLLVIATWVIVYACNWMHHHGINILNSVALIIIYLRAVWYELKDWSKAHDEDMKDLFNSRNPNL